MTTRAYDVIATINAASNFASGQIVYGRTSNTIGTVVSMQDVGRRNYLYNTELMNTSPWTKTFTYTVGDIGVLLQSSNSYSIMDNGTTMAGVVQSVTLPTTGIWTIKTLVQKLAYDPTSCLGLRLTFNSAGAAKSSGAFFNPYSNSFLATSTWNDNRVGYSSKDMGDSWEISVAVNLPSDATLTTWDVRPGFVSNAGTSSVNNIGTHIIAQPRIEPGDTRYSNINYQRIESVYALKNLKIRLDNAHKVYAVGEFLSSYSANLYSINTISNVSSFITPTRLYYSIPVINALSDSVTVYVNNELVPKDLYTVANNNVIFRANTYLVTANSELKLNVTNDVLTVQVVSNNTNAASFISANIRSMDLYANATVTEVNYSPYITEKNSIQQTPIVRLFSIYYPGEWYPPNANGNPTRGGSGYPWPYPFPLRFAEVGGDTISDSNAFVFYNNVRYRAVASDSGAISIDGTGAINAMTLEISNFEFDMAKLVNNKNLVGLNTSNSVSAYVNGELVSNIDPRTVVGNPNYNATAVSILGNNAAIDYSNSIMNSGTWTPIKRDSRDLLKAVVEIKSVHAKFLDYWPEYSTMIENTSNLILVRNSSLYRVNDNITIYSGNTEHTISRIVGDMLYVTPNINVSFSTNSPVYIVNPDRDNSAHTTHTFIINQLEELNDFTTKFNLTSWLQYLKIGLPNRKFYLNTCPFVYKDYRCKYPSSGSGVIVGSNPSISANGYFTANNVETSDSALDVCARTLTACSLRRNTTNFGGFLDVETE